MLHFEDKAKANDFRIIIGIDEAGRGPLAGPVVAGAVALKTEVFQSKVTDSKKMTEKQRLVAFEEIFHKAHVGIGIMNELVIDEHNILNATFLAMKNAVCQLIYRMRQTENQDGNISDKDVCLLVDGNMFKTDLPYHFETIVKGDSKSLSIAAASVIAKVTRDRILYTYDKIFPQYGFKKHKGYPTAQHKAVIREIGLTDIHRKSFRM